MNQQFSSILFFALYLAFTPIVFWLWFYNKRDKEGLPVNFMFIVILLGAVSVLPAVILEYAAFTFLPKSLTVCFFVQCQLDSVNIGSLFFSSFFVVALAEEFARFAFLYFFVRKSGEFSRVLDGIRYGALFGLGFAGLENGIYLFESFYAQDFNNLFVIFILRFFVSSDGHALYGAAMGYFLVKLKFMPLRRKRYFIYAFIVPFIMHGLFDFFLSTQTGFYSVFLVAAALAILLYELNHPRAYEKFMVDKWKRVISVRPTRALPNVEPHQMRVKDVLYTCPMCHNVNIFGAKFCAQCGYALE